MVTPMSRPDRWRAAVKQCRNAIDEMEDAKNEYDSKMEDAKSGFNQGMADMNDIREEYQEWLDNLPENLESSPLADKLNEITSLTTDEVDEEDQDSYESALNEVEEPDFPLGFGRD